MAEMLTLTVPASQDGVRVDRVLTTLLPDLSRATIQRLIAGGSVVVAGQVPKAKDRAHSGDTIEVELAVPASLTAEPEPMELVIPYEDACMVVVDKPAGLVVHPAAGHAAGTLVNGLTSRYPGLANEGGQRPGLVHRLDKDTSGLMVVALTPSAQQDLTAQLTTRRLRRTYTALVRGRLEREHALIDVPVGRDAGSRKRMAGGSGAVGARPARTRYEVIQYLSGYSLIRVILDTGRTHQIRVHMAYIGHPVAGDRTYSPTDDEGLHRQFLHASRLDLRSPCTGEDVVVESPLPQDLREFLDGVSNSADVVRPPD